MMDGLQRLRPVGRLERYSTARHDLRFYLNVAVTASYRLPASCSLPLKHYLYEACRAVVGQHPILSAIPIDENTNDPYFVRLPEINLDQCVSFHQRHLRVLDPSGCGGLSRAPVLGPDATRDADLDELLTIQHNTPFTPPHPFWRLCVLTDAAHPHSFTAAFVFHHAVGDGGSGMAFHRTLQQALSEAASVAQAVDQQSGPVTATAIISSPSTALLPNLEDLHPLPVSIFYLLTRLFKEKVWLRRNPGLWTGSKISVPLVNKVRHVAVAASTSRGFRTVCRTHGTTVTAALQTLIAGVLFAHLPATFTALKCAGAISMRRWLPDVIIDDDSIGVFVRDLTEEYSRSNFQTDRLPWVEAKRSRDTIEDVLSLEGKNGGPNLLRYINNYQQELFLPMVGQERESSYEVTNVGVFKRTMTAKTMNFLENTTNTTPVDSSDADADVDVNIGRMVFTQSANVTGSAFEVSAISGPDGCLVLGFAWQTGAIDDDLVPQVLTGVHDEIRRLTTNQAGEN